VAGAHLSHPLTAQIVAATRIEPTSETAATVAASRA
jgi:hypothetical protein